jgi:hypothetical protein
MAWMINQSYVACVIVRKGSPSAISKSVNSAYTKRNAHQGLKPYAQPFEAVAGAGAALAAAGLALSTSFALFPDVDPSPELADAETESALPPDPLPPDPSLPDPLLPELSPPELSLDEAAGLAEA